MKNYQRFLNYVRIPTASDPNSASHPSTLVQMNLSKVLVEELRELGIADATMDKRGYVYGTVKSNTEKPIDVIGFIAHVDTSCDASGENIKPRIISNYDGEDVLLNEKPNIVMKTSEFPFLKKLKGQSLIVTDGTTLLGADDKAGIAEIMGMIQYFSEHPEVPHGEIKIAFTPDEEIGSGPMFFDVKGFNAKFAYTIDGGKEGVINFENFNAASCEVSIKGINIHPGDAKNHMKNSLLIAMEFNRMLPEAMIPAHTELYEGFNHLNNLIGDVEKTKMHYIIRNHDKALFLKQKAEMIRIQDFLNEKYGPDTVEVKLTDSYYNMRDIVKDHMEIVDIAAKATEMAKVPVVFSPIRGGTDGAQLTYKGLICPNLGTGGYNFHGRFECITIEALDKVTEILVNIVKIVAQQKK